MFEKDSLDFKKIDQYISEKVSIYDLYEYLTGHSTQYKGSKQENVSCPFHGYRGDLRPSATLYPESNKFHCHVCDKYPQSPVDFVRNFMKKNYIESLHYLEDKFKFNLPEKLLTSRKTYLKSLYNPDQLKSKMDILEDFIIENKKCFSFIQYVKIFSVFDKLKGLLWEHDDSLDSLKELFNNFDHLKKKVNQIIFKKMELERGREKSKS